MDVLRIIAEAMQSLGLAYSYEEWTGETPDPYWVGEYIESPATDESGLQESSFILTGTTRGAWLSLEDAKGKIERAFPPIGGLRRITDDGNGVAVWYSYAQPVPTDTLDLKRMQINLEIKQWKVA